MSVEPTDIGYGISIEPFDCSHGMAPAGWFILFPELLGTVSICAECRGPTWNLESLDPLTLDPSIRTWNGEVEYHGHIHDGKWVPV